jgi:branched-chain amino acid transport system substrate-binding protein
VDSQVVSLQSSGADALLLAATPKFAAQAIKKVAEVNWHPAEYYITNVSYSPASVLIPAGADNAKGIISAAYLKDPSDPQWANDAGVAEWRAFVAQWMPGADLKDSNIPYGYALGLTLKQVLTQCGDDLSRENIMKQAASLNGLELPTLLPGVKISTSATNFHPLRQMQLARWTGESWSLFGGVLEGA